jgi:hypothetical protein
MSTEHIVLKRGNREVSIIESSAKFDLNLYGYPEGMGASGPQNMTAEEALNMAAGIIYAVWCSYPDRADALVDAMAGDNIPGAWNKIVRKQSSTEGD